MKNTLCGLYRHAVSEEKVSSKALLPVKPGGDCFRNGGLASPSQTFQPENQSALTSPRPIFDMLKQQDPSLSMTRRLMFKRAIIKGSICMRQQL